MLFYFLFGGFMKNLIPKKQKNIMPAFITGYEIDGNEIVIYTSHYEPARFVYNKRIEYDVLDTMRKQIPIMSRYKSYYEKEHKKDIRTALIHSFGAFMGSALFVVNYANDAKYLSVFLALWCALFATGFGIEAFKSEEKNKIIDKYQYFINNEKDITENSNINLNNIDNYTNYELENVVKLKKHK